MEGLIAKLAPNAAELLDILDVPVIPLSTPAAVGAAEAAVIEHLERAGAERVLVVGEGDPEIVRALSARVRVAVSENHLGDPRAYSDEGITMYDLSIEDYVAHFHDRAASFDAVVVQGASVDLLLERAKAGISALASGGLCVIIGSGGSARAVASAIVDGDEAGLIEERIGPEIEAIRIHRPGQPAARVLTGVGSQMWAIARAPGKRVLQAVPALRPLAHRLKGWLSKR